MCNYAFVLHAGFPPFVCRGVFTFVLSFVSPPPLGAMFEPRYDKTNKVTVRPAKTQISLSISPV